MRKLLLGLVAGMSLLPVTPALAQEQNFSIGAGGLEIGADDRVAIASQDVYVSREAVRLRYVLRNRTAADVNVPIRFALPDRTPERDARELRWPSDIRTAVDGAPVAVQPQRRALLRDQDHTELLTGLGIPLSHRDEDYDAVQRALAALPRSDRSRLVSLGLIDTFEPEGGTPQYSPRWTVRESWQWDQVVPTGRDLVVEHGYRPGLAGTTSVGSNSDAIRNSEAGQAEIRRYCLDEAFLTGFDRLSRPGSQGEYPSTTDIWFTFFNGSGPMVGDYRLVVDRGDEATIAGFCGEGARSISPTKVELRRTNWRPEGELNIYFVSPGEVPAR